MSRDIWHPAVPFRARMVAVVVFSGLAFALCDSARAQAPVAGSWSGAQDDSQASPQDKSGGMETPPSAASRPSDATSSPRPATPRAENPGLINEIGKLLERRQPLFPALPSFQPFQSPPAADQAGSGGGPAPGAKEGSAGIPRFDLKIPSMQTGREKCPVTANGASDCKAAADALCRAHGYKEGKSNDTAATEKCSAEALLLSGRKSQPGACRTDYFVTRAWCQ